MVRKENPTNTAGSILFKVLVLVAALAVSVALGSGQAYAQEGDNGRADETEAATQAAGFIPESYEYVVDDGDNQTLLVRRSAQLYDLADESIELSPAQLIYVETNVVQDMGARDLIHPDEMINVMSSLVAKYAGSSQELSASVLDAWQVYADNANLEIEDISPKNVDVSDDGQVVETGQDDTEAPAFNADQEEQQTDETQSNDWAVWLVVGGVTAILVYGFLRAREQS